MQWKLLEKNIISLKLQYILKCNDNIMHIMINIDKVPTNELLLSKYHLKSKLYSLYILTLLIIIATLLSACYLLMYSSKYYLIHNELRTS